MRVSILDDYQGVALDMADWSALRARGIEIAVERHPFADEDDVVRSLADSEIVAAMRERTAFPKRVVDRLPKLKLLITTGMRNASFDMGALKERGVTVCGTGGPGGGNEDTAELAWGLILGAARRIAEDHQMMRQGGWQTRIGHRVAGKTIGLNIGLPHEQRPNPYITRELTFEFHYFFMRKLWFAYLARALVVFPGGFGTLDELTEILTLMQTRKIDRHIPVVLYGSSYWNEIINFDALVRHGMIDREDLALFQFADDPASALRLLQAGIAMEQGEATPAIAHSRRPHG